MDSGASSARLLGLVLAGGRSRRMGADKGGITYRDSPQAVVAWELLSSVCERAFVSVNETQVEAPPYSELPIIVDAVDCGGPAAGLMSAWNQYPNVAWLVLAVDLPNADRSVIQTLINARDPHCGATALRHPDKTLEPLCTIWEPVSRLVLEAEVAAGGASLRRVLERSRIAVAEPAEAAALTSINTPTQRAQLRTARSGER